MCRKESNQRSITLLNKLRHSNWKRKPRGENWKMLNETKTRSKALAWLGGELFTTMTQLTCLSVLYLGSEFSSTTFAHWLVEMSGRQYIQAPPLVSTNNAVESIDLISKLFTAKTFSTLFFFVFVIYGFSNENPKNRKVKTYFYSFSISHRFWIIKEEKSLKCNRWSLSASAPAFPCCCTLGRGIFCAAEKPYTQRWAERRWKRNSSVCSSWRHRQYFDREANEEKSDIYEPSRVGKSISFHLETNHNHSSLTALW